MNTQNYKDIFNLPDKDEWMNAIKEEINNMKNLNVFSNSKQYSQKGQPYIMQMSI